MIHATILPIRVQVQVVHTTLILLQHPISHLRYGIYVFKSQLKLYAIHRPRSSVSCRPR